MSLFADKYAAYVLAAYGATFVILGWLVVSTLAANARARRELEEVERRQHT